MFSASDPVWLNVFCLQMKTLFCTREDDAISGIGDGGHALMVR